MNREKSVCKVVRCIVNRAHDKLYGISKRLFIFSTAYKRKLLDLLGDMRLAGGYLNARITAYKPGHTINTKAAKALRALLK